MQDYRGLRRVLLEGSNENVVPIFNEESFPIPTREIVLQADWPKRKSIIGRGVLALTLKSGAFDFADGVSASKSSITSKERPREYHHLFPDSTLEDAGVADEQSYRALNCALITWRTNRVISNKDPIRYLRERAKNAIMGELELRHRLRTHLIPYSTLAVGYEGLSDDERRIRVKTDYPAFLNARAELMVLAARAACEGRSTEIREMFPDEESY